MGCRHSRQEGACREEDPPRTNLLSRSCATVGKMLSALHPKNHTVPIYRRTFRLSRFEIHVDLWVSEQLARRRGGGSRHAEDAEECEVHENAAATEVGGDDLPRGATASFNSRRGSAVAGNSLVQRDVIVEPRPVEDSAEDAPADEATDEAVVEDAVVAEEVEAGDSRAEQSIGCEAAINADATEASEVTVEVVTECAPDEDPNGNAPTKSMETAV